LCNRLRWCMSRKSKQKPRNPNEKLRNPNKKENKSLFGFPGFLVRVF
jgi:hypothetical protein